MDYKPSKAFKEYQKNGGKNLYSDKPSHFRITFNSPVVLIFAGICFIATILGILSKGTLTVLLFSTSHSSLSNPMTYLHFITHAFGHADWNHFFGNITTILLLGPMLEEKYGSRAMIEIIVLTAVVAGVFNYIFFPNVILCGASGVVFAFILMASFTGFHEKEIPITFLMIALIYIGGQIYEGLFVQNNISNTSHILGGIVGAFAGYILNRIKE